MWGTEIEDRMRHALIELDPGYEAEICKGFFYRATPLFQNKIHLRESLVYLLNEHLPPDTPILDYGCGTGQYLLYLRHHGFTNLHGWDQNERWLVAGRHLFERLASPKDASFRKVPRDSIYDLKGFGGQAFGVVTMFGLIYGHGIEIERVFESVYDTLLPGGYFFANDSNHQPSLIRRLLKEAGFQVKLFISVEESGKNIIYGARKP